MAKYLLVFSLIAAGAGVATAKKGTSGGGGGSTGGSCKLQCNTEYQAGLGNCAALYGTGATNVDYQNCAHTVVADYYACVSLCH